MKIWKASFAAILLVLPVSSGAFADTSITLAPAAPQPAYGSYNPSNPAYGALPPGYQNQMIPGGVQQYYNSIMSQGGAVPQGQQAMVMNGGTAGQQPVQVQYHYKNPNPNIGGIPDDQLPQRLFHNIPPHYYGAAGDR